MKNPLKRKKKEKPVVGNCKCEICKSDQFGMICMSCFKKKQRELMKDIEDITKIENEKLGVQRWNELKRTIG